jgi:hypothetical protein
MLKIFLLSNFLIFYYINSIEIGFINNTIYIPGDISNVSTYNYLINCKECICYGFLSNINSSLINCIQINKLCLFYLNFNPNSSFVFNQNSSIYLLKSKFSIESTNIYPIQATTQISLFYSKSIYFISIFLKVRYHLYVLDYS